jgi:hypothetical protein
VGVCEEYDSMGVRKRTKRAAVNSRQFKVERANSLRAKHRDTEYRENSRARRDARGGERASSRTGRGSGVEVDVHGRSTVTRDNLSRYFLCSNDSNGMWMGRKLIRGMGMRGNLVRENGVCVVPGKARRLRGERTQTRILNAGGCCGTRQRNTEKAPPFRQPNPKGRATPEETSQNRNVALRLSPRPPAEKDIVKIVQAS